MRRNAFENERILHCCTSIQEYKTTAKYGDEWKATYLLLLLAHTVQNLSLNSLSSASAGCTAGAVPAAASEVPSMPRFGDDSSSSAGGGGGGGGTCRFRLGSADAMARVAGSWKRFYAAEVGWQQAPMKIRGIELWWREASKCTVRFLTVSIGLPPRRVAAAMNRLAEEKHYQNEK